VRVPQFIAVTWLTLVCTSSAGYGAEPAPLTAEQERALTPKDTFRECENCPEMVIVPAGAFTIGGARVVV
jgi:hypothetical protein